MLLLTSRLARADRVKSSIKPSVAGARTDPETAQSEEPRALVRLKPARKRDRRAGDRRQVAVIDSAMFMAQLVGQEGDAADETVAPRIAHAAYRIGDALDSHSGLEVMALVTII